MNEIIVMLAMTTRLSKERITRKIQSLHRGGVSGVMLYARSGLEVEYMSEDWRSFCADIIEAARAEGMTVWLYDEFNWPSGACKGMVVQENPAYEAKRFVVEDGRVSVRALPEEGTELIWNRTDLLNPQAVDCFIRKTHEQYYRWFGKDFGGLIEGIFTDEPSYIYACQQENMLPYYEGIHQDYAEAFSADLEADMLDWQSGGNNGFPKRFYAIITRRFRDTYLGRVSAWCQAHGLKTTGHLMNDDDLYRSIRSSGDWFASCELLDVPGLDNIVSDVNTLFDCTNAKLEALRLEGKKEAMAELFALGPCNMSFAKMTQTLWHNAAYGINRYFVAVSHFDAKGNWNKPDYFTNFTDDSPHFAMFPLLAEEARKAAAWADKEPVYQVAVRYPYSACLDAMSAGQQQKVADNYQDCVQTLIQNQIPWRLIRESAQGNYPVTVSMDAAGFRMDDCDRKFDTMQALLDTAGCFSSPAQVLENGKLAENVFVKAYTDGSVLVIDRSESPAERQLELRRDDLRAAFTLSYQGVRTLGADFAGEEISAYNSVPVTVEQLRMDRDNLYRCEFYDRSSCILRTEEPVRVRIHVRQYPAKETVMLDGKVLAADRPCDQLTNCFNPLYTSTGELVLTPGEHVLTTEAADSMHLPAVLLGGDFVFGGNCLYTDPGRVASVPFFGCMTATVTFSVPENAREAWVSLGDQPLAARLELNGKIVSENIASFGRLALPADSAGKKVTALVHVYSSLAPIFGDVAAADQKLDMRVHWVRDYCAASRQEMLDVQKLCLLYR